MSEQSGLVPEEHMTNEELMANAIAALNNRIRHKRRRKRSSWRKPLFYKGSE